MRNLILMLLLVSGFNAVALTNKEGINFFHGTYEEALAKARAEKKLVFIDFYTQWCGPCKLMAEEVFTVSEVGDFYNDHFINIKIDAEAGEGVELAKRFKVGSYPTFCFIDPETDKAVHKSGTRQDVDLFLFTAKSAISPELRSTYLETEYQKGNHQKNFLYNYCAYLASINQSDKLNEIIKILTSQKDFSIDSTEDWDLFEKYIKGYSNPYFNELLNKKAKYVKLFGEKRVDAKIYKEFNYCSEPDIIKKAPEFVGKDFLWRKNLIQQYVNTNAYEEAAKQIELLISGTSNEFKTEMLDFISYTARTPIYNKECPPFWEMQCLKYTQYVAYNYPDRKNYRIHFDYANLLEKVIRKMPAAANYFPIEIAEKPSEGKKEYSIKPEDLKPKPKR